MIEMAWRRSDALPGVEVFEGAFARELPQPMVLDAYIASLSAEGHSEMWAPTGAQALTPGRLLLSSPGNVVRVVRRLTPRARIQALIIAAPTMAEALEALAVDGEPIPHTLITDDAERVARVRRLYAMLDDGAEPLALQTELAALLSALAGARVERSQHVVGRALRRARELLHDQLDRNVTLDELAAVAQLSKFYVARRFTAAFGLPPHRYHLQLRLDRARALLVAGWTVGDVASELAFADQSHLTRRFSRAFGIAPARYRALMLAR